MTIELTGEQRAAIERRDGSLMLSAGAGSGKTTVLVSRFVASILEDGIEVDRMLAITFTEKAAAELAQRVAAALRAAERPDLAARAQSAWISTIHGFCARLLRAQALRVGLDPEFSVLDPTDAVALRAQAYQQALRTVASSADGARLVASYPPASLRATVLDAYAELRARGQREPQLPQPRPPVDVARHRRMVAQAAFAALSQLAAEGGPAQVQQAVAKLASVPAALEPELPWPGTIHALALKGTAKALKSEVCDRYHAAIADFAIDLEREHARRLLPPLQELLALFGQRYRAAKQARSTLDFEDLELEALRLLEVEAIAAAYHERFERVMVDEMQDTNAVQHQLIERIAAGRLFMVGDAQQSIYGFRHADVELFTRRGGELAAAGAHLSLQTNFRTLEPILDSINGAFETELGDSFMALTAGRGGGEEGDARFPSCEVGGRVHGHEPEHEQAPLVEMIVAAKPLSDGGGEAGTADEEGGQVHWRSLEAEALATRIAELIEHGEARAGEIVILLRAGTDMALYERALAAVRVDTQVVGGRGYWQHPQVLTLTSYLRALANPLDEQAYYATLLSPLCGISLDGAVLLAAGAREEIAPDERRRLQDFERWFADQRLRGVQVGVERLLLDALALRGYRAWIAAHADGSRRLANVRKLRRIARQFEAAHGSDLHGFVDSLALRASGEAGGEAEASASFDFTDTVRLMTIHAAKGLEFKVVCVADLGRQSRAPGKPVIRLDREGRRIGLLLRQPGSMKPIESADYRALAEAQAEREDAEQRRLFYVAATRARDRLILSGAAKVDGDWERQNKQAPIGWLAPAFVPDIASLASAWQAGAAGPQVASGVAVTFVGERPTSDNDATPSSEPPAATVELPAPLLEPPEPASETQTIAPARVSRPPTLTQVSYSSIAAYERCAYRYYLERIIGLRVEREETGVATGLQAHGVLRALDLNASAAPASRDAEPEPEPALDPELAAAIATFASSATAARLRAATSVSREQPFVFELDGQLITGTFDVWACEPGEGQLIIDYKSDRIDPTQTPSKLIAEHYAAQRDLYALAGLLAGAERLEVQYVFLRSSEPPVSFEFGPEDQPGLLQKLRSRLAGQRAGQYPVSDAPGKRRCEGCVAAGGLCPHPVALTGGAWRPGA